MRVVRARVLNHMDMNKALHKSHIRYMFKSHIILSTCSILMRGRVSPVGMFNKNMRQSGLRILSFKPIGYPVWYGGQI